MTFVRALLFRGESNYGRRGHSRWGAIESAQFLPPRSGLLDNSDCELTYAAGISGDQPEQSIARHPGPPTGGGAGNAIGIRIRRHPAVPRREKRKTITARRAGAGVGTPMAFLASRRLRSHGGAEPSLLPIRTRETALCHRALRQGDESSLRGPGTTPREEPLRRRRRLLDRGYRHLSLDRTVGDAAAKP